MQQIYWFWKLIISMIFQGISEIRYFSGIWTILRIPFSHANWNFLLNIWYGYYAWDLQALNIFGFSYIWFWIRISSTQNVNANDLHFEIKKIYQVFSCNHISNDIAIASSPLVSLEFYEKQLDDEYFMRFYSILGLISFEMNNFDFFASINSK